MKKLALLGMVTLGLYATSSVVDPVKVSFYRKEAYRQVCRVKLARWTTVVGLLGIAGYSMYSMKSTPINAEQSVEARLASIEGKLDVVKATNDIIVTKPGFIVPPAGPRSWGQWLVAPFKAMWNMLPDGKAVITGATSSLFATICWEMASGKTRVNDAVDSAIKKFDRAFLFPIDSQWFITSHSTLLPAVDNLIYKVQEGSDVAGIMYEWDLVKDQYCRLIAFFSLQEKRLFGTGSLYVKHAEHAIATMNTRMEEINGVVINNTITVTQLQVLRKLLMSFIEDFALLEKSCQG